MKKILVVFIMLFLMACTGGVKRNNLPLPDEIVILEQYVVPINYGGIVVFEDTKQKATCWLYTNYNQAGMSCIPDSLLEK